MTITIIKVELNKDRELLRHVCRMLYKDPKFRQDYDKNNMSLLSLINYYQKKHEIQLYAAFDNNSVFIGCYSKIIKNNIPYIYDLYVIPSKRKSGIGKLLLLDASKNEIEVRLLCYIDMIEYYESNGFIIIDKYFINYLNGESRQVYEMAKLDINRLNEERMKKLILKWSSFILITFAVVIAIVFIYRYFKK